MRLAIFEQLHREFGYKVEGVQFTMKTKEEMAVHAKRRLEEMKCRLPDTDSIRNGFRSVKKTTSVTGQARFDAVHDEKFGHADHWWAFCLAESAAGQPLTLGLVEYINQQQALRDAAKVRALEPQKCPKCGSDCVVRRGPLFHSNCCGVEWSALPQEPPVGQRRGTLGASG